MTNRNINHFVPPENERMKSVHYTVHVSSFYHTNELKKKKNFHLL